jgi:serine/threonine protein kinase/regulation of enolase protein 1 (concanavalin A-like superfamily)
VEGAGVSISDPEATAAYDPADPLAPRHTLAGPGRDLGFFDPPRADGELGWMAHYQVLRPIGEGGMGLVFQAVDTHLLRTVALKVIRPELADAPGARERFLREARAAAAIKHDHIVTIYQVGQQRDVDFLAMEFLQGMSLQRWLDRGKAPTIDQTLRIGREVASGLAAAHRAGLIHRDIKPGNIWLEAPSGRAKILDFGHARATRDDSEITRAGTIMGTPAYMSPEQARGEPADASSDLFSLGCVLYRLLAGRLPFRGDTILGVLSALATETPPSPRSLRPETPAALDDLVMRLLAKPSAERPASAQAVVDAIRGIERQLAADRQAAELSAIALQLVEDAPKDSGPVIERSGIASVGPRRGGRGLAWGLGATALAAMATAAVWLGRSGSKPSVPPKASATEEDTSRLPPPPVAIARVEPAPPVPPPSPPAVEAPKAGPPAAPTPDVEPPKPPAPKAESSAPKSEPKKVELAESVPAIGPWEPPVDPDANCKLAIGLGQDTATIQVPGTAHLLSAELGRMNAPRVLREVRGDFEARVRVAGVTSPSSRSTMAPYPPYHGAGLLIWQDPQNYVRLEIATEIRQRRTYHYANYEYRKDGRLASSVGQKIEGEATFVRLERVGGVIQAAIGPDGTVWTPLPPLDVALSDPVKVGLTAISTSSKPLVATFQEFRLVPIPAAPPNRPNGTPGP